MPTVQIWQDKQRHTGTALIAKPAYQGDCLTLVHHGHGDFRDVENNMLLLLRPDRLNYTGDLVERWLPYAVALLDKWLVSLDSACLTLVSLDRWLHY